MSINRLHQTGTLVTPLAWQASRRAGAMAPDVPAGEAER